MSQTAITIIEIVNRRRRLLRQIAFQGENDADPSTLFAKITGKIRRT